MKKLLLALALLFAVTASSANNTPTAAQATQVCTDIVMTDAMTAIQLAANGVPEEKILAGFAKYAAQRKYPKAFLDAMTELVRMSVKFYSDASNADAAQAAADKAVGVCVGILTEQTI